MAKVLKRGGIAIMIIAVLLLIIAITYQVEKEHRQPSHSQQLKQGQIFTEAEKKKLKLDVDSLGFDMEKRCSYEIYSHFQLKGQFFVKVIFENDWNEMLYHISEDKDGKREVECIPEGAGCYDDISFYDNVILPESYGSVLLSVSSSSHMGNGFTEIFAFTKDGIMKKLLEAGQTVDKNYDSEDGIVYHNGLLNLWIENNSKHSKYSEFQFSGEFNQYGVDKKTKDTTKEKLYRIGKYKRVYRFDEKKRKYVEVVNTDKTIEKMDGVMTWGELYKEQDKEMKNTLTR